MSTQRILLIEDDPSAAQIIKGGLENAGYFVVWVASGVAGLKLALTESWHLMILDVMLPGKDGWEILTELRRAEVSTLALFLTARDQTKDRVQGLELGADSYLVKPFSFAELLAVIRSLLRRNSPNATSPLLELGSLSIDRIRQKVTRSGQLIELTPKEYSLLVYLAERRGEIVSRKTLARDVWGLQFETGTNLVEVHIRRLRSKIDEPFPNRILQTVRGVGYVLQ